MLEYRVKARRIDAHGSVPNCKAAVPLDTDVNDRQDALAAELLLAAIAACMIKGVERLTQTLSFDIRGVEVHLSGLRQDSPLEMMSIECKLLVDTVEDDHRLDLPHQNVRKYGTISNTVATASRLQDVIRRKI